MSSSFPSQILIIRHGEKLGEAGSDKDGGPDLSMRGSSRAAALPSLFAPATPSQLSCPLTAGSGNFTGQYKAVSISGKAQRFQTPNFIFATAQSNNSNRPIETITPTSIALGLSINGGTGGYPDTKKGIEALVTLITTGSTYAGNVVLICWHHGTIPELAKKLGIAKPPTWGKNDFDRVWQITFPKGTATLAKFGQKLLYGDK